MFFEPSLYAAARQSKLLRNCCEVNIFESRSTKVQALEFVRSLKSVYMCRSFIGWFISLFGIYVCRYVCKYDLLLMLCLFVCLSVLL